MLRTHVFPVQGGGQYTDDWGGARSPGSTGGTGRHQGTDIFAPAGTPVVAVTDGKVTKIGNDGGAGGNRVWINGSYYYAHLKGFAKGIRIGTVVKAGQVIGYVGDTGDAKGTPPHLHFGYDPNGRHSAGNNWENPYPLLERWKAGRQTLEPGSEPTAVAPPEPTVADASTQSADLEFGVGAPVGPPMPEAPGAMLPGSQPIPYREPGEAAQLWQLISPSSDEGRRFLELAGGLDAG